MEIHDYQILSSDFASNVLDDFTQREDLLKSVRYRLDDAVESEDLNIEACYFGLVSVALVDALFNGVDVSVLGESKQDEFIAILNKLKKEDLADEREKAIKILDLIQSVDSKLALLYDENSTWSPQWRDMLSKMKQRLSEA